MHQNCARIVPQLCHFDGTLWPASQGRGEPIPLTNERIHKFGQDTIAAVQEQMQRGDTIMPSVSFLPGTNSACCSFSYACACVQMVHNVLSQRSDLYTDATSDAMHIRVGATSICRAKA